MLNTTEMTRLAVLLAKADIPFELVALSEKFGGEASVQIVAPNRENGIIDAICHQRSYGGNIGLLEVWCDDEEVVPNKCDGWLNAEEAFEYFAKTYDRYHTQKVCGGWTFTHHTP